jgi:hypothetical protein
MHTEFIFDNLEGKTPLWRPRYDCKSDIKIDLEEQIVKM